MTETDGEFASLWREVSQLLRERETSAKNEETERQAFLSEYRVFANRAILPVLERAAKEARGSCYEVPSPKNDTARCEMTLTARRLGGVASVYPGKVVRKTLENKLTFGADAAGRQVRVEISGVDVKTESTEDLELNDVNDAVVRQWVTRFIQSLSPSPSP